MSLSTYVIGVVLGNATGFGFGYFVATRRAARIVEEFYRDKYHAMGDAS